MSILGHRVLRKEDPHLITGGGTYVDSLPLPSAAHVTFLRSPVAHARITALDVAPARSLAGVIAAFTGSDLALGDLPLPFPGINDAMKRPVLARDIVRFVGEPVAVIVTEERGQGTDAVEAVVVDYDPLPAVTDVEASIDGDVLLFPAAGSNIALQMDRRGDDTFLADAAVVVRQRMVNHRVAPVPIESRVAAAEWDGERLTFYGSTQMPHGVRDGLARALGLEAAAVRVRSSDVGGGFGAKAGLYAEEVVVGWLARRLQRPVRWSETRTENMLGMTHGRGQVQDVELGADRDGRFIGLRMQIVQDAGAYPSMGAVLPFMTRMMASGVYQMGKVDFGARSVLTTTTPIGAYRGAGRPEAAYAVERIVDIMAAELGLDPAELRRRNVLSPEAFPYKTPTGANYDVGAYAEAIDRVLAAAGYEELRAEQAARRQRGDGPLLGIGLSCYVEVTNGFPGQEFGAVTVHADGSATARTGSSPHGQGHVTSWAMIVSDRLGIPIDRIEVVHGDTDAVPFGGGTGGSKSLQAGGAAVAQAAGEVVEKAKRVAGDLLEAAVEDVVLDTGTGRFHVAGSPSPHKEWSDLAEADPTAVQAEASFQAQGATFPFGAHLAVVEIDPETGKVELLRLVACDDAGRIVNPVVVEGQVHGGLAQGIAQALYEEILFDEDGNPLTGNLADYAIVGASELPMFETVPMETPTPMNELGAKGIGESATIGSTPAVVNAVVDALAHLGIRHVDMPLTPQRVWEALRATRSGDPRLR